ncbi:hypothetical protein [Micromonospora sp. RTGN7]|uniref:hypothetical protein n=1 Tax=Micromonospora sp. RTGN7 TaxID=3016526 RepID=UPI0029FF4475|nr:hypothetical protein [Micromonospora sp. RTGN7]
MTDLYRNMDNESTPQAGLLARATSDRTRLLLWVALVVSVVLNITFSMVNTFLGAAFGIAVLACAWALVVRYRRGR